MRRLYGSLSVAVAASGLVLVLFALIHLGGLGLAWWDPPAFERYAAALHQAPWLPAAEVGLLALLLLHPAQALARALANRRAQGAGAVQRRSRREGGVEPLVALAGRLMPWSGGLLLVFLLVHLAQLRLRRPAAGAELAVVQAVLQQPHWLLSTPRPGWHWPSIWPMARRAPTGAWACSTPAMASPSAGPGGALPC